MKKILKITIKSILVLLLVVILLLVLVPILFKDKIMEKVKTEINKSVNAKVDFADFDLSVFRSFPQLNIELTQLQVVGIDTFAKDTLVKFDKFSVDVNLMSAISGDEIKVKAVDLYKPSIFVKVLKGGKANYDIAKPSTDTATSSSSDTSSSSFKLALSHFKIHDAQIVYQDSDMNMWAKLSGLNYTLSGDMTENTTVLDNLLEINKLSFNYEGAEYLKNSKIVAKIPVDADLKAFKFTFKENSFIINALELGWNGWVSMPKSDIDMDLTFFAKKTEFKNILSLIPALYAKDFESIKTEGKLALNGFAKGKLGEKSLPLFGGELKIENAKFSYPDLPKSVSNIQLNAKAESTDSTGNNMNIDISTFHVEMAGNPLDVKMHIGYSPSDIAIKGKVNGTIDMTTVKDIYPLDSMTLSGSIITDVLLEGKLSSIEQEKYEEFNASGKVELKNFGYVSSDLPQGATITQSLLIFSPQFVELQSFDAKIGKSDAQLNGKFENYLAYALKGGMLVGKLNFASSYFDVNEYMTGDPAPVAEPTTTSPDTTTLTAFDVPSNIDFSFNSNLKKVLYDKLEITNILGIISLKNKKLSLDNLSMNLLNGSMVMNGSYNSENINMPLADFSFAIQNFDIPSTFEAFNTIQKVAPIAKNCMGSISLKLVFSTVLDKFLSPLMQTMNGVGSLQTANIGIKDSKLFTDLSEKLKNDKFKQTTMSDINANFKITNGTIEIEPFKLKVAGYDAQISGKQGLDQTIDYLISTSLPFGNAGAILGNLTGIQTDKNVNVIVNIGGTLTDPKIVKIGSDATDDVKKQVEDIIKDKTEDLKKQASEQAQKLLADADAKAKQLIAEAENAAAKLKEESKKAAELIISEADKQGKKLVEQTNNPLAKAAANKAAEKLNKEAKVKADKLVSETELKSNALIDKAKAEAEKIKADAQLQADKLK